MIGKIADGRTDLVYDYVTSGHGANSCDANGVSLLQWCAYYGDVSALQFLIANGAPLESLGANLDLHGAAFHGHWQLCQFLIEHGAEPNLPHPCTGETPLHAALCTANRIGHDLVIDVLLAHGATPNCVTKPGAETECFMRDCRTKSETPLHRAAAFGTESTIQRLLNAGAQIDAKDMHGDSPLTWASWHLRPVSILRMLCYGKYTIHPDYGGGMEANLLGKPHK